jgi:hypothetical protein
VVVSVVAASAAADAIRVTVRIDGGLPIDGGLKPAVTKADFNILTEIIRTVQARFPGRISDDHEDLFAGSGESERNRTGEI